MLHSCWHDELKPLDSAGHVFPPAVTGDGRSRSVSPYARTRHVRNNNNNNVEINIFTRHDDKIVE